MDNQKQHAMKLNMTDFLFTMSFALDAVEKEVIGVKEGHGLRVAYFLFKMLEPMNLTKEEIVAYIGCAILHDNGIAQYQRGELELQFSNANRLALHTELGEKNVKLLPLGIDVTNIILHHHENADGTGPFGLKEVDTNEIAQLIHIADIVELAFDMKHLQESEFHKIEEFLRCEKGKMFSNKAVEQFLTTISYQDICHMQKDNLKEFLHQCIPSFECWYSEEEIKKIAQFFMTLVDYKSSFTKDHSLGVAEKALKMAEFYNFDYEKSIRYYFAGAFHDIGKLVVHNVVLEKPGKLDANEFQDMKRHAKIGYELLKQIHGFDDIAEWAGNHHEKLDGQGYARGLKKDEQSFESRLMACVDIYQALTESRPYKKPMSHQKTISIMMEMANENKIDKQITLDMNYIFAPGEEDKQLLTSETVNGYVCQVCGYIYEGDTPPEICPICDSSVFVKK